MRRDCWIGRWRDSSWCTMVDNDDLDDDGEKEELLLEMKYDDGAKGSVVQRTLLGLLLLLLLLLVVAVAYPFSSRERQFLG